MSSIFDRALKLLGDGWTLNIIWTLAENPLRFTQLEKSVVGICPATLTNRLKVLEEADLIKRQLETIDKQSVVYQLTEKGQAVVPIVKQIGKFATKFSV